MQKVILDTQTNYKGRILIKDDRIDLPDNIAGRWVRFRIAHYQKVKEKLIPVGICKPTSIIILVKDCLEYTKKCLDSLAQYTSNFELLIIDNGSSKQTVDYLKSLKKFKDCKLVLNDKNLGVPYGWDQGIKLAKHDYIAFINNDVIFTPDWLYHLQKCFDDNSDCAVASPTTCFSAGSQCDKTIMSKRSNMSQAEMNSYAASLEYGYISTKVYGFCFLIHRKVIDKIGVFDYKRYGLGTAEEADFNWRAKEVGFKTYWVKHAYVHHYGHITFDKGDTGLMHNDLCRKNRVIFDSRVKNDKNLFVENDVKIPNPKKIKAGKTAVIMVTLDRKELTIKTLDSLFENKNIEVIIIDNNSEDIEYLKDYKVKLIKNSVNVGVTKAVNQGLEIADSKYVVIIHNDITVTPGWIDRAIKFMDARPDVGIVGTAGWTDIYSTGYKRNIVTGIAKYDYEFPSDFVEVAITDGQCNIIRNVGIKLDEAYGLMHFYDKDLSLQYKELGYKIYVVKAEVDHKPITQSTESTTQNKQYKDQVNDASLMGENRKIFMKKWQKILPVKVACNGLIPILMTTYNRLSYTKKALPALLKSVEDNLCEIFVFDNNSTDGTQDYLKSIKDERVIIYLNKENEGAVRAKNMFFERYRDCKYVAFVDNDSIVTKGWLNDLKAIMDKFPLLAVQLEHYVGLGWKFKENIEWFKHLYQIDFNGHNLYLNNFVGGSGEIVRMSYITDPIPEKKGSLSGWGHYLHDRFNKDNLVCAFYDGYFMELLDMTGTNQKIYEFDDYKKELAKLGRKDFGWAEFGENDRKHYTRIRNKIKGIVDGWN